MTQSDISAKFDKFHSDYNGKPLLVLPSSIAANHGQCFDAAAKWASILGVPNYPGNPSPFPYANAHQIYDDFGTFQATYFDRIPNTPDYVPLKGDILVWDANLNGGAGHVAVATADADTNYFISFDENWDPSNWYPQDIWHDYDTGPVLGALRFKVTSPGGGGTVIDNRPYWFDQMDKVIWNGKPHEQITQNDIDIFVRDYPGQYKRSGEFDQLGLKGGLTGASNNWTVDQIYNAIIAKAPQTDKESIRAKIIDAIKKVTL